VPVADQDVPDRGRRLVVIVPAAAAALDRLVDDAREPGRDLLLLVKGQPSTARRGGPRRVHGNRDAVRPARGELGAEPGPLGQRRRGRRRRRRDRRPGAMAAGGVRAARPARLIGLPRR
jgi:hypothetical protein